MSDVVVFILFCVVSAFILFSLFSRRGRMKAVTMMFPGSEVIADYGELQASGIRFGSQKLHVYGMEDSQGRFIAIENRQTAPRSFQITWLRLDDSAINELKANSDALMTVEKQEPEAD